MAGATQPNAPVSPQLQGLGPNEIECAQAMRGGNGLVTTANGDPLLADAFAAKWHNEAFFQQRFPELSTAGGVLYLALEHSEAYDDTVAVELTDALSKQAVDGGQQVVLFHDYYHAEGQSHNPRDELVSSALAGLSLDTEEAYLGEDGASYAHVHHFDAVAQSPAGGVVAGSEAAVVSGADADEALLTGMWGVYEGEFAKLAEVHPINGQLSQGEFEASARAPGMQHSIRFDESGVVEAFGSISNSLETFDWLDLDYFAHEHGALFDNERVFYGPTVVTNGSSRGATYLSSIFKAFVEEMSQEGDHVFAFECSDRSARYIPKRIQRAYNQLEGVEAEVRNVGSQVYRATLIG